MDAYYVFEIDFPLWSKQVSQRPFSRGASQHDRKFRATRHIPTRPHGGLYIAGWFWSGRPYLKIYLLDSMATYYLCEINSMVWGYLTIHAHGFGNTTFWSIAPWGVLDPCSSLQVRIGAAALRLLSRQQCCHPSDPKEEEGNDKP